MEPGPRAVAEQLEPPRKPARGQVHEVHLELRSQTLESLLDAPLVASLEELDRREPRPGSVVEYPDHITLACRREPRLHRLQRPGDDEAGRRRAPRSRVSQV